MLLQMLHHDADAVDEEGYPRRPLTRDNENGELLGTRLVPLSRTSSNPTPTYLISHPSTSYPRHDILQQHQAFSGFRIHSALSYGRAQQFRNRTHCRPPASPFPFRLLAGVRPFRVGYVPPPPRRHQTIRISAWEEFIHGPDALWQGRSPPHTIHTQLYPNWLSRFVRCLMGDCLPTMVKDAVFFIVYIILFFVYALIYNDIFEIIAYIMFLRHLNLHELAYEHELDVEFVGSKFQGPAYACMRAFCEHCVQRVNAKVMDRHMKKMKEDILGKDGNDNSEKMNCRKDEKS